MGNGTQRSGTTSSWVPQLSAPQGECDGEWDPDIHSDIPMGPAALSPRETGPGWGMQRSDSFPPQCIISQMHSMVFFHLPLKYQGLATAADGTLDVVDQGSEVVQRTLRLDAWLVSLEHMLWVTRFVVGKEPPSRSDWQGSGASFHLPLKHRAWDACRHRLGLCHQIKFLPLQGPRALAVPQSLQWPQQFSLPRTETLWSNPSWAQYRGTWVKISDLCSTGSQTS